MFQNDSCVLPKNTSDLNNSNYITTINNKELHFKFWGNINLNKKEFK